MIAPGVHTFDDAGRVGDEVVAGREPLARRRDLALPRERAFEAENECGREELSDSGDSARERLTRPNLFYIITVMRKRVDAAAQRLSIASAAARVIGRAGLEGARLRDVARAADVTTGAITHYFDGKEAVLLAALAEVVRRTLGRMDAAPAARRPGDVRAFVSGVCAYLPASEADRSDWRVWLAFWGRAVTDARLRAVHRAYYRKFVARLIEPLRALAIGRPKPTRREAGLCADAVIAALDGIGTRATLEPERWPHERQRETLRQLLSPMLVAFASRSGEPRRRT